ncbi:GNAT family N-acetyltransferase [Kitasatospora sp. NBC_01287]|uniref:GNAT family N-acetyltransferase n=1 Tax=Kitasatospora sp. NBC_01287 TaxID=2903573 RepID=UPI002258DDBA|nr:GNAT family N-acetyltransferase [Kitasatospora sp. NBC_01287]MCX4745046.1 GNAT family N-acetyltransferase [Kitasatospora sp. NBC_01287]
MAWEIHPAPEEADVRRCWPVFRELRQNIPTEEMFVARWKVQRDEGYRIVYLEQDGEVRAVGGYRIVHNMAWGRILYLDDLAALTEHQGEGLGTAILEYVQGEAVRHGCDAVHLDTGYQRNRAHRAYLRNGFELSSHHLEWKVPGA